MAGTARPRGRAVLLTAVPVDRFTGTVDHMTGMVDHFGGMPAAGSITRKRNEGNEMMLIPTPEHIPLDGSGPPPS